MINVTQIVLLNLAALPYLSNDTLLTSNRKRVNKMTQEMCRFCLSNSNLNPIFMDITKNERYTTVLALTTGLKIEPNDGLPQQLCENCTVLLNSSIKFRNQCHLTQIKLLQINFLDKKCSQNLNETSLCGTFDFTEDSNEDHDDESTLRDFQIEVEFQRVTECRNTDNSNKNSDNFDIQDGGAKKNSGNSVKENGGPNNCFKLKPMSRKEKRDMYLGLVDGVLDAKKPVRCKICKKTVSKWSCFINHAKLHLGFKFMCEFCGKSFISSTQLKLHCRSHHGMQRELACKDCSYLALDAAQLVLHERRMHTGERPFVCDTCGASYHSRRCLLQHVEGHRPTATVQCENCPLKFKSPRHLARHRYSAHTRKRARKPAGEA